MASNLPTSLTQQQKNDITNYINPLQSGSIFVLNDALAQSWSGYGDSLRQRLGKIFYEEVGKSMWSNIYIYSYENNHAKYVKK